MNEYVKCMYTMFFNKEHKVWLDLIMEQYDSNRYLHLILDTYKAAIK